MLLWSQLLDLSTVTGLGQVASQRHKDTNDRDAAQGNRAVTMTRVSEPKPDVPGALLT
jgi:hypothetical protein